MERRQVKTATTSRHDTRWALASLSLSVVLSSLGTSIANVALPTLATALDASFAEVQWVVIAYLLGVTALVATAGRLGDVYGAKRVLLAGVLLFTATSAFAGSAPSIGWLIAARAVQGVGAAVMMALAMALVSEIVPRANTGSAMGLLGTMSAVGTALGPTLGGALIAAFGWRAIFFANVPLGLIALVLLRSNLPANAGVGVTRAAFDWRRVLVEDPGVRGSLAMSVIVMTVMMATLVVGPFYLSGALGLDVARTGLVMSIGPVVAAMAGVPSGKVVDRVGPGRATIAGLAAIGAGSLMLAILPTGAGVVGYFAPMGVMTAGFALFQAANNTGVMQDVAADRRGALSGLLNLSRNLGLITGATVMGAVYSRSLASALVAAPRPEAVAIGMRTTFAVAAILTVVSLTLAVTNRARATRLPSFTQA